MNKVRMAVQYDNGDVIEQDNCTITMNIMPTAEEYKNLGMLYSMLNYSLKLESGSSSYFKNGVHFQHTTFLKQTSTILNSPTLLLYDSFQNKFHPEDYIRKDIECIGYAESINAFSGSDTKRGTINLTETINYVNKGNFHQKKLVFDFPTHVANGKIDTVVLSPFQFNTIFSVTPTNGNYVKYQGGIVHLKPRFLSSANEGKNFGYPTQTTTYCLNSDATTLYAASGGYVYIMNTSFPTSERFENNFFSSNGLICSFGEEVIYKKNRQISSNEAVKINIIDGKLETTQTTINFNIIDKTGESWSSAINVCGYFEHENIKIIVFEDCHGTSSYKNYSIQIFDMNDNFIKKSTVIKNTTTSAFYSSYMCVYNNFLFINYYQGGIRHAISLTTLEIEQTSTIFPPFITSDKKGQLFAGFVSLSELFADNSYVSSSSSALGRFDIDNQGIRIDLAEPIYKNNSQAMKLIFDLDITIE